uniref:AMOP domain-containing protein n=1 Tax=Homalodisca liturata TaxID=320908 RepID=A0A1B6IQ35_9HEMI
MQVTRMFLIGGVLAITVPPPSLYAHDVADGVKSPLTISKIYPGKNIMTLASRTNMVTPHKKRRLRHRGRNRRRQNVLSSAKRYFEKQLLVKNSTLALLGIGMEKLLPNAVDLLDINPQELPGESPFQNWHSKRTNQSQHVPPYSKNSSENIPTVILSPIKLLGTEINKNTVSEVKNDPVVEYQFDYHAVSQHEETGHLQLNFGTALKRLLRILNNYSTRNNSNTTPCEQWMGCQEQLAGALLGPLPACPCVYPSRIFYEDKVWDTAQERHFRWKDASGERLDVYKPGAEYCIRSLLTQGTLTLAVQHCCYDRHRRLLTRGSGAGSPDLVSPDVSPQLHYTVDVLPWRLCQGDFTIYSLVRPPDNSNNCSHNPSDDEFSRQILLAKYY